MDVQHKKNVKNLLLIIQYDGSGYNGWQRLATTKKTIQGMIEECLCDILGEEITIIGSGRTDTGVHALSQVANFYTASDMGTELLRERMNCHLPEDIRINSIEEVYKSFHSRYKAISKTYEYRIELGDRQSVFTNKHCYFLKKPLDLTAMERASALLIGEHDFKGFSTDRKDGKSTVRILYDIKIFMKTENKHGRSIETVCICLNGNGFLYNMVRIIAGTLIEIGEGKRKPECINDILKSKNRELAGQTAMAEGLYLIDVLYDIPNY
ncbi:MAG: tRNA pseudouridine(38-40) synthase TruA [Anaerocolumna sp.]